MKQIISFKKEIAFKTMIGEITSISLEHTLKFSSDSTVDGDLLITGTYKMTEASTLEEPFNYALPVDIVLTNSLEEENRDISIHNFTYQILNEETLEVNVELIVQGVEKVEVLEEINEMSEEEEAQEELLIRDDAISSEIEDTTFKSEDDILKDQQQVDLLVNDNEKMNEVTNQEEEIITTTTMQEEQTIPVMNSIFSAFDNTEETYTTYSIYIVRENDTLDEILNKYNITKEELGYYNSLDDFKVGSKLIIPTTIKDA